jgi:inner membrane protein
VATILTHAVVGAALAPCAPAGVSRPRLAFALAVVSVLPDLDVVGFALGIPYAHPLGHRGFSHSLLFAALLAALATRFEFGDAVSGSRARWSVFLTLFAATASHGALDALTDGGLGVGFLIPFSMRRFFAPVRPLPVSPIGLDGSVGRILAIEMLYVWLPVLVLLGILLVVRSRSHVAENSTRSTIELK